MYYVFVNHWYLLDFREHNRQIHDVYTPWRSSAEDSKRQGIWLQYVKGLKYTLHDCDPNEWSLKEITNILKNLGYKGIVQIFYRKPCIRLRLVQISNDAGAIKIVETVMSICFKEVEVYVLLLLFLLRFNVMILFLLIQVNDNCNMTRISCFCYVLRHIFMSLLSVLLHYLQRLVLQISVVKYQCCKILLVFQKSVQNHLNIYSCKSLHRRLHNPLQWLHWNPKHKALQTLFGCILYKPLLLEDTHQYKYNQTPWNNHQSLVHLDLFLQFPNLVLLSFNHFSCSIMTPSSIHWK